MPVIHFVLPNIFHIIVLYMNPWILSQQIFITKLWQIFLDGSSTTCNYAIIFNNCWLQNRTKMYKIMTCHSHKQLLTPTDFTPT